MRHWTEAQMRDWGDFIDKTAERDQQLSAAYAEGRKDERETLSQAVLDILAEREKQIAKGYTPEHDDEHTTGELCRAAACYALATGHGSPMPADWPWEEVCWSPEDERRNLIRASALIQAAIESGDRKGRRQPTPLIDANVPEMGSRYG